MDPLDLLGRLYLDVAFCGVWVVEYLVLRGSHLENKTELESQAWRRLLFFGCVGCFSLKVKFDSFGLKMEVRSNSEFETR